jgi:hypothetical protein
VIASRPKMALVTAIALGFLVSAVIGHLWWLSNALPRALQQANVNLDPDGSGPPTRDELVEAGIDLRADWLAPLPVHLLLSLQVDTLVRRHWPWLIVFAAAAGCGAVASVPRIRSRSSLRTTMGSVALLAVVLWTTRLWGLSLAYRNLAQCHAWDESNCGGAYLWHLGSPGNDQNRVRMIHHIELKRKYQYAATHPWLPVGTDPPEPK